MPLAPRLLRKEVPLRVVRQRGCCCGLLPTGTPPPPPPLLPERVRLGLRDAADVADVGEAKEDGREEDPVLRDVLVDEIGGRDGLG